MAGTLTQTQLQLQNAESSILFMQQEHAKTLQGLYAEINKLQKKCGEMNFKLAMSTTSSSPGEGKEFDECIEELKELKVEHVELKAILGTKDNQIMVLEGELSKFKKVFEEELSLRENEISELTRELNAKSDTIAYLTNQLHQSKLKQVGRKSEGSERRKHELFDNGETVTTPNVPLTPPITPVPPKDGTPSGVRRRPYKRTSSSPTPQEVAMINITKTKMASSNKVQLHVAPARSNKGMMPARMRQDNLQYRPGHGIAKGNHRSAEIDRPPPEDYVEFLKTGARPEPQVVVHAAPEPLPPIASHERIASTPYTRRVQVSRGHPAKVSDDVGTIIVSPLSSPEKGWRHRQQSQQQNGGPD